MSFSRFCHLVASKRRCADFRPAARLLSTSSQAAAIPSHLDLSSPANTYIRKIGGPGVLDGVQPDSLKLWPDFLDKEEQKILLAASLRKLDDATGSREARKRRKRWLTGLRSEGQAKAGFAPDEVYGWEPRHFDGVISSYREMNLSEWPNLIDTEGPHLQDVLRKIYSLLPSKAPADASLASPSHLLTHLLHLSSTGYILPHVDNIEASAGTIVGISLGAERNLVLEKGPDRIEVRLPAGSAYLQSGDIRYKWKHSIPVAKESDPKQQGQRLSVMIRDRHS